MKHLRFLLAAWAAGASLPSSAAEPAQPVPPRFSVGYMDAGADPRADFARYAFGAWQKKNPVPPDKARWGSFNELEQFNQLALKGILEAAAGRPHKPGSVDQKIGDGYRGHRFRRIEAGRGRSRADCRHRLDRRARAHARRPAR